MIAHFFVNGGPESAAGLRARRFAAPFGDDAEITYRQGSRLAAIAAMVAAARRTRPDVIYSVDLAIAPVAAASRVKGSRFVVDTGDIHHAFLSLVGAPWPERAAARLLERAAFWRADEVVVRGARHLDQLPPFAPARATVIPDGVDLDRFRPIDVSDLRARLGLAKDLTVGIQGNFTWYRSLGGGVGWELVHALAALRDLPIRGVLVGDGPGLPELRRLAHELGVGDRLHVLGRVPYERLPEYLNLFDVCLLTQTDDVASQARTTGKLPCYLACGRFILATRVGTAADLLPEEMLLDYDGHWDVAYPTRLARRLAELLEDPGRGERGLALREAAHVFDYGRLASEASSVIRRAAGHSSAAALS